jgi:probable HAF family extracellular repeat protein
MKIRSLICAAGLSVLSALTLSIPLSAQNPLSPTHYRVIDLGTLGGPVSSANTINNLGWAMGGSVNSSGNQIATLWLYGLQIPLGTINGGAQSNVEWPNKNNFGLITGITNNGTADPLGETFSCPAVGLSSTCVAFAWQFGQMKQLPGLGGNNSIGASDNNPGQIVGWAETNFHDPTCAGVSAGNGADPPGVQFLQFEATLWQRAFNGKWQVKQLPPYSTDPDSAATAINDLGQVVGISGRCDVALGSYSAIHSVLWQNGKPVSLGSLGGSAWNTPEAINNRGVVVGFDNGPNDVIDGQLQFRFLAYIWTKQGGMVSLGTLPSLSGSGQDAMSEATDINNEGQIVGVSYSDYFFDNPRAFIWQNSSMTPLNALIGSASSSWDITSTGGINDHGEIAAQANPVVNGVVNFSVAHAVLLVPCAPGDPVAYGAAQQITAPNNNQDHASRQIRVGHFLVPVRPQ